MDSIPSFPTCVIEICHVHTYSHIQVLFLFSVATAKPNPDVHNSHPSGIANKASRLPSLNQKRTDKNNPSGIEKKNYRLHLAPNLRFRHLSLNVHVHDKKNPSGITNKHPPLHPSVVSSDAMMSFCFPPNQFHVNPGV